jgi:hypothetical protein
MTKGLTAPKWISPRTMATITNIDRMGSSERKKVFEAYEYDPHKQLYKLEHEEKLDEITLQKIIRGNE